MIPIASVAIASDHCRIGSLENFICFLVLEENDHCRIGSLENNLVIRGTVLIDHCRIGSLESILRRL